MPTRALVVGNTEATGVTIPSDPQRTVLIVQNLDTVAGTDYLWISDEKGQIAATGLIIFPIGGSLTLRRTAGEEPEKSWHLVSATALCPVRVAELFGEPTIVVETKPEEPDPQDPTKPTGNKDAPDMKPEKHIPTGY
ncbi:hypothetical protein ES705_24081 [subsurface metagenome]